MSVWNRIGKGADQRNRIKEGLEECGTIDESVPPITHSDPLPDTTQ